MPVDKDKLQRLIDRFSQATIKAAMADRPEVMQASGWYYDKDGSLVQGDPNAEGPTRLRESIDAISIPVALDNVAPTNNIMLENDFQVYLKDPYTGEYVTSGLDFADRNIGVLPDRTLIGYDLFKDGGSIHIDPKNKGKFNATKARTGKTTEELTHSKNPLTRKRAIFVQNAKKWFHKHADGGFLDNDYATGYLYTPPVAVNTAPVVTPAPVANAIDYDELKRRQYYIESRFNNKAVSHAGAKGAYQIMPVTYKDYVSRTGKEGDLNDYKYNEGIRDYYIDKYLNSSWATKNDQSEWNRVAKTLAAYNWGPGNLLKHLEAQKAAGKDIYQGRDWADTLPKETRNYIRFILDGQDIGEKITNAAYEKAKKKRFDLGGKIERYGAERVKETLNNILSRRK